MQLWVFMIMIQILQTKTQWMEKFHLLMIGKIMTDYLQERADYSYPSTYNYDYNSGKLLARALSSSDYWRNSYEYYGLFLFTR